MIGMHCRTLKPYASLWDFACGAGNRISSPPGMQVMSPYDPTPPLHRFSSPTLDRFHRIFER
jgi:hypothetical protein